MREPSIIGDCVFMRIQSSIDILVKWLGLITMLLELYCHIVSVTDVMEFEDDDEPNNETKGRPGPFCC